jgi:hypothetical protein
MIVYWTTPASLLDDIEIMAEWGFVALRARDGLGRIKREDGRAVPAIGRGRYSSEQVWHKIYPGAQTGMGLRFWGTHESILYGVRGKFVGPRKGEQPRSLFDAPVGEHSEKPRDVHAWLDEQYPNATKIELFHRDDPARPLPAGWHRHGDEAVRRAVRAAAEEPTEDEVRAAIASTSARIQPVGVIEEIPDFLRRKPAEEAM